MRRVHTGWRAALVVVVLLFVGLAGGYAAALALARQPAEAGVAEPVAAASPSIPLDPPPLIKPDPEVDPLPTDLEMRRTQFRGPDFSFSYPRPRGWALTRAGEDHKWRDPSIEVSYTYLLRVRAARGRNESIARMLTDRVRDIDADQQDVTWLEQTTDSLSYSYLDDGHLRFGLLTWLDVSGSGLSEVEVAVTGREVDRPGLQALLDTVVAGVRQS